MGKEADMSEGPSRKGPEVLMMSPMGYPLAPQHGYGYVPHPTQQGMFDEMMWQFRQEMGQMSKVSHPASRRKFEVEDSAYGRTRD